MKAVMYHYVRGADPDFPFFTYLDFDSFRRQLDWFMATGRLVCREEFEEALRQNEPLADAYIPTFDDGLAEHARLVGPELAARNTFGLFFVPTGPMETGKALDAHRVHCLLGRNGGEAMLEALVRLLETRGIAPDNDPSLSAGTYRLQPDKAATRFKRILNYQVGADVRSALLDALCEAHLSGLDLVEKLYMTPGEIRALSESGMIIGSHSVSHRLFSRMDPAEQEAEIEASFCSLLRITGKPVDWFCYPFGGWSSFTPQTETLLAKHGCRHACNVEERDIEGYDLLCRPLALPRYDCNLFPHGQAVDGG